MQICPAPVKPPVVVPEAKPVATEKSVAAANTTDVVKTADKFDINAIQAKKFNFFSYLDNVDKTEETAPTLAPALKPIVAPAVAQDIKPEPAVKPVAQTVIKPIILDAAKEPVIIINNKEMTPDALVDDICWKMGIDKLTVKQRYDVLGSIDVSKSSDVIIRKLEEKLSSIKTQFSA
ncbi:MAG: hypothetical protein WCF95_02240 [bacterium]